MKVLVVGANGKIGKQIVSLLGSSDQYTVRAMIRKEEQAQALEKLGAETIIADLETETGVKQAANGCDAIIFTAGSGGHTGADKTMLVDLDGAFKTIEAAEEHHIKRFIMVSALHSDDPDQWKEGMEHYYTAKRRADERLRNSELPYTILRPGWLTNDPGKGTIEARTHLGKDGSIPRQDVAQVAVEALQCEATYHKTIEIIEGDEPIHQALQSFN